jgi:hypothetical protein
MTMGLPTNWCAASPCDILLSRAPANTRPNRLPQAKGSDPSSWSNRSWRSAPSPRGQSIDAVKRGVILVLQRHVPGRLTHSFFSGAALASTTSQSSRVAGLAGAASSSLPLRSAAHICSCCCVCCG